MLKNLGSNFEVASINEIKKVPGRARVFNGCSKNEEELRYAIENKFLINGLSLNKNFKINDIDKVDLNFFNKNKKENKIFLNKNKKNYEISGKVFDGSNLLDEMFKSNTKKNAFEKQKLVELIEINQL